MAIQSHGLRQEVENGVSDDENIVGSVMGSRLYAVTENVQGSRDDEKDFMTAAVSVAISRKGLSSNSYQ